MNYIIEDNKKIKSEYKKKIPAIIIFAIACIYTDRHSIIPMLGVVAVLLLYPFKDDIDDMGLLKSENKRIAMDIYVIAFVLLEFFFSYIIRIFYWDIFVWGSIYIGDFNIISSFVVIVEILSVIVFYLLFMKKRLLNINKHSIYISLVILIPFILSGFIMASYDFYVEMLPVNILDSLNSAFNMFFVTAVSEEIIFRGMLYDYLKTRFSLNTSRIIQAFIFMLAHGPYWVMIFTDFSLSVFFNMIMVFILGIVAAIMRDKNNSLLPSIVMHGALNGGVFYFISALLEVFA